MLHREVPASLQNMKESHHIGFHIGFGIIYAVADARLRPQIHHNLRPELLKHA